MSNKLDYLKKYTTDDKKLKKKATKSDKSHFKIVDDEALADLKTMAHVSKQNHLWEVVCDDGDPVVVVGKAEGKNSRGTWTEVAHEEPERELGRRGRHDSDDEPSPPRRKPKIQSEDIKVSQDRLNKHNGDDESPPRKLSAPKRRHDSDDDESPPRRTSGSQRSERMGSDGMQLKRTPNHQDNDESPPRRRSGNGDAQRRSRHDSDDESPPRRPSGSSHHPKKERATNQGASASDVPTDRNSSRRDDDESPPRRRGGKGEAQRRSRHDSDDDKSPPRRSSHVEVRSGAKMVPLDDEAGAGAGGGASAATSKEEKRRTATAAGHIAGLQAAADFGTKERELRHKREAEHVSGDPDLTGENASTVYRDRRGKKLDMLSEFMRQQATKEGNKVKLEQAQYEWGKGSVQKENAVAKAIELQEIALEPFARTVDNPRLEAELKQIIRDGDPMADYFRQQQERNKESSDEKAVPAPRAGGSEKQRKPLYKGPAPPPNRFNILPGYRWDAVDRGSGFERKLLMKMNERTSVREDAHAWSVTDM